MRRRRNGGIDSGVRPLNRRVLQGTLVLPDRMVRRGQLVIGGDRIAEIGDEGRYAVTHDYGDAYILPGLIDLHVHGMAGGDVMDGSRGSIDLMSRRFATHGVTGWLASTVTETLDVTEAAIDSVLTAMASPAPGRAHILGIHLEGPFLNPEFKGMQNPAHLLSPDVAVARALLQHARGTVVKWSLAPELPGAEELMALLRREGVRISIAHTAATYEQAMHAVDMGAVHVTHCFNAMTGLHHRKPGVAGAAMLAGELFVELIADGVHVHPAVMQLLIRVKGRERVMLVTDSMSAADMQDGEYRFGGREVSVRDGIARLADGTLASSTLTMDGAVRNLVTLCHVSLIDAAYMGSTAPAIAIGLGDRKGVLAAGHDADFAVFDTSLAPRDTWISGVPLSEPVGHL